MLVAAGSGSGRSPSGRLGGPLLSPRTPLNLSLLLDPTWLTECRLLVLLPKKGPSRREQRNSGFSAHQLQPWGVQSSLPLELGVCGSLPRVFRVEGGSWLRKKAQAEWLRL